ncbi:hypothetical protein TCSYLVIO_008759 [Trypanosoma cruzi]|nr:hypothetical protein TCSYLVIO_008759 [Trypanosoma cruzi]
MRRGQQAQPHSPHTTRRHPREEGTQRQQPPTMQEEKTSTTISPSSFTQPQGNGKNPRPPHNAHGAGGPSSIHHAAPRFPAIPPSMKHEVQLSAVTHGASHPQENRLGVRSLSPSPHGHGGRQQPPHATASMHYKRCIQIHCNVHLVYVCGCVCLQQHKAKTQKRGSRVCGGTHKNVQRGRITETTTRRPLKLMTALQPKQRQFTQYLLKTKNVPFVLCKPHHTK